MTNSGFWIFSIVGGAFAAGLITGVILPATSGQESDSEQAGTVTGIGGVFFKAEDPAETVRWYRENLGISGQGAGVNFFWRDFDDPDEIGFTVWSVFPGDTDYFGPGEQQFMVNYRVQDLDSLLARLGEQGVEQVGEIDEYSYGRFAWIVDLDGRRIELWEPISEPSDDAL